MAIWNDILKAKLETLLGERGSGTGAAVRRSEIDGLLSKAATVAAARAETAANARVAEALKIAKRAEAAVEALRSTQAEVVADAADETTDNERLSDAVASLFQWNGGTYALRVPATGITGKMLEDQIADEAISIAKFAAGLRPVELLASLPTTGNFDGRHVYRTSDKSLWRHNGTAWVNTNSTDLLVGKIVAGQIEVGAVGADQIAANAVTATKLAITDATNLVPDSDLLDAQIWNQTGWSCGPTTWGGAGSAGVLISDLSGLVYNSGKQFPVTPNAEYFLSYEMARRGTSGQARVWGQLEWIHANGTSLGYSATVDSGIVTDSSLRRFNATLTAPATAARARWRWAVVHSDTTAIGVAFWAPTIRLKAGGQLIVDGAIKANHLTTASAVITDTAQIANLIVDTIHVKDGAITVWRKTLPADKSSGWTPATWNTIGSITFTPRAADMVAFVGLTINRGYTGTLALRIRWRGVVVGDFIQPFDETYGRLVEFRHFSAGGLASGTLDLQILRYEGAASLAVSDINIVVAEFMK